MTECQGCRAKSQLPLCDDCQVAMRDALAELPFLLGELETTRNRTDRLNLGIVGRSSDTPSPINWGAARLADEVHDLLVRWMEMISEQFKVQFLPALSVPTGFIGPLQAGWRRLPRGYSGSSLQRIAWLTHHAELIARHTKAGDIYVELLGLTGNPDTPSTPGRLVRAINRNLTIFAGMCPTPVSHNRFGEVVECGNALYADEDAEDVECARCLCKINVARNRSKAVIDRDLMSEKLIIETMTTLDEKICKERFAGWLRSGRLATRGYLHAGAITPRRVRRGDAALYSLSQARQLRWHDQAVKEMA